MAEAERITISVAMVDVGKMDLLIDEGVYATRSDFVRAAIRTQLGLHRTEVEATSTRRRFIIGTEDISRADLEDARSRGQRLHVRVIGVLTLADDISPDLADETIESVAVYGSLRVNSGVRKVLGKRILR